MLYTVGMVTYAVSCSHCASLNLTRNGRAPNGKQKYLCHDCGKNSRQNPGSNAYADAFRQQVLAAYHERCSLRGGCRIFGISRQTLVTWLKKSRSTSTSGEDTCPA